MSIHDVPVINEELLHKENYIDINNEHPISGKGISSVNLVFSKEDLVLDTQLLLVNKDLLKDAKSQVEILKELKRALYLY
jgi:hypothetical protein